MEPDFRRQWRLAGGISGLAGVSAYFAAALLPLPAALGYLAAFSFGPFLAVGLVGLCYQLEGGRAMVATRVAAGLGIAAGVMVLAMLCVQQSIFEVGRAAALQASVDPSTGAAKYSWEIVNAVQLGLDVAWDVLISASTLIFSGVMLFRSALWKVSGTVGMALSALLLSFNLAYFPVPPADSSSIDWGPFVALWMTWIFAATLASALRERRAAT